MRIALVFLIGILLSQPGGRAFADPGVAASLAVEVAVIFTDEEIRIIRDHYHSHADDGSGKGKGKGRHKGLPPGIA
jgi:hypothetical protein